jgi:preprotein translocase SecE subunit
MARDAAATGGPARPERRPVAEAKPSGNPIAVLWRFGTESVAELKKVEWPGQNQVIQGTVVVLVACVIVGTYLWLNDQVWKQFVEKVLLR